MKIDSQIIFYQIATLYLLLLCLVSANATSMTAKSKNPDDTKTKGPPRRLVLVPKTVYVPHYTNGDPDGGPYEAYLMPKVEEPTPTIFLAPQVAPAAPVTPSTPVEPKGPAMQYPPPGGYYYPPPPSYFSYPNYSGYQPMAYQQTAYQPMAYQPQMPIINQYASYSYFGMGPQYSAVPLDLQSPMSGYVGATSSVTSVYSPLPVPTESAHVDSPDAE